MAVEVTTESFEREVLQSEQPVLVDFWAPWCGPCRMMSPTVDELAKTYEGRAKVVKVDVDQSPEIAAQYQISSIPTFIAFENGKAGRRLTGAVPVSHLEEVLDDATAQKACSNDSCGCSN